MNPLVAIAIEEGTRFLAKKGGKMALGLAAQERTLLGVRGTVCRGGSGLY